jgi:hypothetical protein
MVFTAVSLPYMKYIFPPLTDWVASIPGLNPPEYSIFRNPSGSTAYSPRGLWASG